jgi:hypothetical protein
VIKFITEKYKLRIGKKKGVIISTLKCLFNLITNIVAEPRPLVVGSGNPVVGVYLLVDIALLVVVDTFYLCFYLVHPFQTLH